MQKHTLCKMPASSSLRSRYGCRLDKPVPRANLETAYWMQIAFLMVSTSPFRLFCGNKSRSLISHSN